MPEASLRLEVGLCTTDALWDPNNSMSWSVTCTQCAQIVLASRSCAARFYDSNKHAEKHYFDGTAASLAEVLAGAGRAVDGVLQLRFRLLHVDVHRDIELAAQRLRLD